MKKSLLISALLIPLLFVCSFSQYGKWEKLNPEHNPGYRAQHKMAKIDGNKVLLFGGENGIDALNDTWIFDLNKGDWIRIDCQNTPTPRYRFGMCSISEKRILIFGGTNSVELYNDLWFFDLDSLNWFEINPETYNKSRFPLPTDAPGLCEINDSLVLNYGGNTYDATNGEFRTYTGDSWIFNLNQLNWRFLPLTYPRGRVFPMLENIGASKVFMCGGGSHNNKGNENWIFNINYIFFWQEIVDIKNNLPVIVGSGIARIGRDNMVLFGGWTNTVNSQETWYDSTWIFISDENSWYKLELPLHPSDRYLFGISRIDSNKALLFGGSSKKNPLPDDTWLFTLDSIPIPVCETQSKKSEIKTFINSNNELILDYYLTESGKSEIEIFNINGICMLKSENKRTQSGWNRVIIPFDKLPAGVYFVRVRSGSLNLVGKFLVY